MSSRAGAFRVSSWLVSRVVSGVQAVHQGFWLGLLDVDDLREVTATQYERRSKYHAADYNMSGFWTWEEDVVARFFGGCRSVLLGAAGGGREIVTLVRRGIQVDAFDCSPELVAACRHLLDVEGIAARVLLAPPDRLPEELRCYDGAIMGWGGYMHIAGREARVRLLGDFRRHLRPGSPLLLSFFHRQAQYSRHYRVVRGVGQLVRALRGGRRVVELGDSLPDAFVHCFTEDEVRAEMADAGFRLESFSESVFGHAVGRVQESHEAAAPGATDRRTLQADPLPT